jgi:hypothetical protein
MYVALLQVFSNKFVSMYICLSVKHTVWYYNMFMDLVNLVLA